jgi:fructokinase
VSTIGAGDNFNAGFLYGLLLNGITRSQLEEGLSESQWDSIVEQGTKFSAEVCRSLYNYVSPEFGAEQKKKLTEE